MSVAPFVSIVIPTYQRPASLRRCLEGFLAVMSEGERPFEVIVVDDASSSEVASFLAADFAALPLRWVRHAHNRGPAAARNSGARLARGEVLLFTDDDCWPTAEWIDRMATAVGRAELVLVGGQTINALPRNLFSEASQQLVNYLYEAFADQDGRFFTSNNMGLRREAFQRLGGFDETMPLAAGEDRELCDRWLAMGGQLVYEPEARLMHAHAMTLTSFWQQHWRYGRGAWQYHQRRAARNGAPVRVEPLSFYGRLLGWPLKRPYTWRTVLLVKLLLLSQIANAVGFFRAKYGRV